MVVHMTIPLVILRTWPYCKGICNCFGKTPSTSTMGFGVCTWRTLGILLGPEPFLVYCQVMLNACMPLHIYVLYMNIYEGCSKLFHLENVIFAKKKILSPNFRELHVFLSRHMLAKILKKNVDAWYPQIVPGVWSLVTLHSAAAALKHLRSALRSWSLLTFIGQFWHNKSTV